MSKWTALLANLKQKSYDEASKQLQVIQDYDDLQDALQVIPFKTLNADLPESLDILEKLYTKFISLTNNKEEGRLIIRHVFKVDGFLANVIRTRVRDAVLGRSSGPSLDEDSIDHITQITWSMDSTIVKELMTRLTELKFVQKHCQKGLPEPLDVELTNDEIITDLKCTCAKFNSVIQHLGSLANGGAVKDGVEFTIDPTRPLSKIECGSSRDMVERIKKRFVFNQAMLDVVEPCKENIERTPVLIQGLKDLVESDQKFLGVMTELCVDIFCYGNIPVEKVIEQYVISYKSVLSAVVSVNEPSYHGQRSNSLDCGKDRSLVNNGLKIEVNGSPFRRNFDGRRLYVRDKRERKEPSRSHSCREPRRAELFPVINQSNKSDSKLKEKLNLKEKQLEETRSLVKNLRKREEQLLQKLTEQAKTNLISSEKFENITQDTPRVDQLVRQYDDLYSQLRLDALDDLDKINSFDSLEGSDEIKCHVTFAVISVSFHLAQQEIENRRKTIYSLLNLDNKSVGLSLRNEISLQLRRSAATIDLQHVVEQVCNGLCQTMFDFPELESCDQLHSFVEACVRFSWSICAHVPPLTINYDSTKFNASLHNKSHTSNKNIDAIKHYVWPTLVENDSKAVLYKGIVVT